MPDQATDRFLLHPLGAAIHRGIRCISKTARKAPNSRFVPPPSMACSPLPHATREYTPLSRTFSSHEIRLGRHGQDFSQQ